MFKRITTLLLTLLITASVALALNRTLVRAQELLKKATKIEEVQQARRAFDSAKKDPGYKAATDDSQIAQGIRACDVKIKQLTPDSKPSYTLKINGNTSDFSYKVEAARETLNFSVTSSSAPTVKANVSWLKTTLNTSKTNLSIFVDENYSYLSRSGTVTASVGTKKIVITIEQDGVQRTTTQTPTDADDEPEEKEEAFYASKDTPVKVTGVYVWSINNGVENSDRTAKNMTGAKFEVIYDSPETISGHLRSEFYDPNGKILEDPNSVGGTSAYHHHLNILKGTGRKLIYTLFNDEDPPNFIRGMYKYKLYLDNKLIFEADLRFK